MQIGPGARSYQLHILLEESAAITVGSLGTCTFPRGSYIYTGSAKRNMEARVTRHLSASKTLRWHIDYLLGHAGCRILEVSFSVDGECELNRNTPGEILIARFGATDCRNHCGSHLKYLGLVPQPCVIG